MTRTRRTLTDAFELSGRWWPPDHEDAAIAGRLCYSPSTGIELDLMGSFAEEVAGEDTEDLPLICGMCQGAEVSLLSCHRSYHGGGFPGFEAERYWAETAIIGWAATSPDECRFTEFEWELSLLGQ